MSLIRRMTGGRRRSNVYYDPFSLEETGSAFMDIRIDWKETPNAHIFKADLPGINKDVKMEVQESKILEFSGERRKDEEEKTEKWYKVERRSGKFLRRFKLPENANVADMNTSMEDGVLTVTLPKIKSFAISG